MLFPTVMLLKLESACHSPGVLSEIWILVYSRSGVGPKILHFKKTRVLLVRGHNFVK